MVMRRRETTPKGLGDWAGSDGPRCTGTAPRPGRLRLDPWPEFSDYGCFSCHHSLRDEASRRQRATAGISGARNGAPGPSHEPRAGRDARPREDWKAFVVSLDQLKAEMVRLDSDRTRVIKQVEQAASPLNRSLDRLDSMSLNQRTMSG